MIRLTVGGALALALWLTPGCDGGVDTNRTDRVTSGKEADDIDAPTPLPRADAGAGDEGGDIPPAPTPDEGSEGEKPVPDSGGSSGDGSGDSGGSGGCSGGGCGGSGGGCGGGGWSGGGCSG